MQCVIMSHTEISVLDVGFVCLLKGYAKCLLLFLIICLTIYFQTIVMCNVENSAMFIVDVLHILDTRSNDDS